MKPFAFALLAALTLAWALPAAAAGDFPVPPTPDHHVVDAGGVLSSATRTSLENELTAYEAANGHQIVVYIAPTTGGVPLETWTVETANKWKIGHKGKEDGAILFVFMKDHKARIEVGYGLEGKLPDADASRIITDEIVPKMKTGDVDGAIAGGVAAMLKTITPGYNSTTPTTAPASSGTPISDGMAALLLIVFVLVFGFVAFVFIVKFIGAIRYGILVLREGQTAANNDMKRWWFWGAGTGAFLGSSGGWSSGGGGWGGGGGGGFSAGGGSFGGGGASGGW